MLVVTTRPINKTELTNEQTDVDIITLLQDFEGLKKCNGNPKRIMALAEDLKDKQIRDIQHVHAVVNKLMGGATPENLKNIKPQMDFQAIIREMNKSMLNSNRRVGRRQSVIRRKTIGPQQMPQNEDFRNTLISQDILKKAYSKNQTFSEKAMENPNMLDQPNEALGGLLNLRIKSPKTPAAPNRRSSIQVTIEGLKKVNFAENQDEADNDFLKSPFGVIPKVELKESTKILKPEQHAYRKDINKSEND